MRTAYLVGSIDTKSKPPRFVGASIISDPHPTSHYYTWIIVEAKGADYGEAVERVQGYQRSFYPWTLGVS